MLSIGLLLNPTKKVQEPKKDTPKGVFFERTGDRTLDPQIKSLLLYQLS